MQINYGGSLEKCYILNPSFMLSTGWSVIEVFLDSVTKKKISFCKKKRFNKLFEHIPIEMLPKKYGGNL